MNVLLTIASVFPDKVKCPTAAATGWAYCPPQNAPSASPAAPLDPTPVSPPSPIDKGGKTGNTSTWNVYTDIFLPALIFFAIGLLIILCVAMMRRRREAVALLDAGGPLRGDVEMHAFDRGTAPLVPSVQIDASSYEAPQSTSTRARNALQALGRKWGGTLAGTAGEEGQRGGGEGGGGGGDPVSSGNGGSVAAAAGGGSVNPPAAALARSHT